MDVKGKPGGGARGTPAAPVPIVRAKRIGRDVEALCEAIEAYFEKLRAAGTVELTPRTVAPATPAQLEAYEQKYGVVFPPGARAFLLRGIRAAEGSVDGEGGHASIGFDFLDIAGVEKCTRLFRKLAKSQPDDDDDPDTEAHAQLLGRGIPLTWSEPQLVVLDGAVYHYSVRNPVKRVCGSWRDFLEAWLAAGCFSSHAFDVAWEKVKGVVGKKPGKNAWLDYYRKTFPDAR